MMRVNVAVRAAGALVLAAACVPRSAPAAAPIQECVRVETGGVRSYVVSDPPGEAAPGAEPFTAVCHLPAEAAAALSSSAPDAAILYVEGLRGPSDRAVTVEVLVGENRVRAGSFTLLVGPRGPSRVPVMLGGVLRGALGEGGELTITLRAADTSRPSAPVPAFTFDRIVIELR